MVYDIAVIGGDKRQLHMITYFLNHKYSVVSYGLKLNNENTNYLNSNSLSEAINLSDVLITPVPFSKDNKYITSEYLCEDLTIDNFIRCLNNTKLVIGGNISNKVTKFCNENQIHYNDLMQNSEISILNSIATAEGVISEAINMSSINLHNSKSLVFGYGKCGKMISMKLKSLDSNVYVTSQDNEELTLAYSNGLKSIKLKNIKSNIKEFDFIFNTIPALVIDKEILKEISKETTIIDIASGNGGIDYKAAKELGLNPNHYLGIPGKISPKSSARILSDSIIKLLNERSDFHVS